MQNHSDGTYSRRSFMSYVGGMSFYSIASKNQSYLSNKKDDNYPPVFKGAAEMQQHFLDQDMDVTPSVRAEPDDTLFVGYTTSELDPDLLLEEIWTVAQVYAKFVSQGYPFGRLEAWVHDEEGRLAGSWYTTSLWAEQYNQNEITEEQYTELVRRTVRAKTQYSRIRVQVKQEASELETTLSESDIRNPHIRDQMNTDIILFYETHDTDDPRSFTELMKEEVRRISAYYQYWIYAGSSISRLDAMINGNEMVHLGRWYIERKWAENYLNGEITQEQYEQQALSTIEEYRVRCHPRVC